MKYLLVFLCCIPLLISCDSGAGGGCRDTNCADYYSQAAAQNDFLADPLCHGDLDADNDNIACEDFFNSGNSSGNGGSNSGGSNSGGSNNGGSSTNCPTTANCGCSGRVKDQCEDECCQWIVGEGCKCR